MRLFSGILILMLTVITMSAAHAAEKKFVPLPQTLHGDSPALNLLQVGEPSKRSPSAPAVGTEAAPSVQPSLIKTIHCNLNGRYRTCF